MLLSALRRTHESEIGISRLTIAVITIACFAVGGLLAYTALSSDDEPVTAYADESNSALELRGTVYTKADMSGGGHVNEIIFTVAIPEDGAPVNFTPPPDNVVRISYLDDKQHVVDIPWTAKEYIGGDGDAMLEKGETFQITGLLGSILKPGLQADTPFILDIKTPDGEVLTLKRATPENLTPVMNLQ